MKEFEVFELSNGIRVVHKQVKRPVAHCGIMIKAGSREESKEQEGLAHFIEHVSFKGTKKRKAYHILSRMEDVGGELNAYTTKEDTVLYSSFLKKYYSRAIELLFDIVLNSTFPEKELSKEKEVIIDEINSYKDSPSELIFDDFEAQLFPNHSLGMNILGTTESVKSFSRKEVIDFISKYYQPENIVFSSVGNISSTRLKQLLEPYSIELTKNPNSDKLSRQTPKNYEASKQIIQRPVFQTHAILGNRAYAADDKKARTLYLMNNILGGAGMNSRLNLNIREKYGFTYNIESFYSPYSDSGVFGIYAGTDPKTIARTIQLIEKELSKLREKPFGVLQLSKAKKQILGQIAMSQENNASLMLSLGKSLLSFDRIDTFKEITTKVDRISDQDLLEVANEIMNPNQLSTLIYQPE
jgi:predicted Zn-dependent peptidase